MSEIITVQGRAVEVDLEIAARDRRKRTIGRIVDVIVTLFVYVLILGVFGTPLIWSLTNSFMPGDAVWENVAPVSYKTFLPFELNVSGDALIISPSTGQPFTQSTNTINPETGRSYFTDGLSIPDIDPTRGELYVNPETSLNYIDERHAPLYVDPETGLLYEVPPAFSSEFTFDNFLTALGISETGQAFGYNLGLNIWISFASAVCVVISSLIFNTFAAYFFGRLKFPFKPVLLVFVVATMMIPQEATIVPLFLVVNAMGLTNTFWALVVPFYTSPFIVFALTQFMADIPYDLDEAAIIDGASLVQVLYYVIVPNAIPGLITVSLLEFQFIWNNFFWPLVAVNKTNILPVQVAISAQFGQFGPNWGRVFASVVLASLPVIVLFLAMQNFYYENIALTGVKG